MPMFDRLVERVLAGRVDDLVRRAIAEHTAIQPHAAPDDPLTRQLVHGDPSRLHVHPTAVVNNALFNLSGGEVTVQERAFFGHNVSILTGTHDVEKFGEERQKAVTREGRDVVVGEGAWVSSFAIVVGPCTIGAHAVVGVGSLVLDDVEPFTVVAGSPAKEIKKIEGRPS
jgi:acetyltransferase-like isoleucine patch superfamily enzyme